MKQIIYKGINHQIFWTSQKTNYKCCILAHQFISVKTCTFLAKDVTIHLLCKTTSCTDEQTG